MPVFLPRRWCLVLGLRRWCSPLGLRLRLRLILGPCLRLWRLLLRPSLLLLRPTPELRLRLRRRCGLRLRWSLSAPELRLSRLWLRRLRLCLGTRRLRPTPELRLALLRLRLSRRRGLRFPRCLSPPELRLSWLWLRRLRLYLGTRRLRPTLELRLS